MNKILFRPVHALWLASVALLVFAVPGCDGIRVDENGISIIRNSVKPVPIVQPVQPITSHEFRCLVLHDPKQNFTSAQLAMLYSATTRDFMAKNAVKGVGGRPDFRVLDGTPESIKTFTGVWKEMVDANPPKELPWVIMTNGAAKSLAKSLPTDWAEWKSDNETMSGAQ